MSIKTQFNIKDIENLSGVKAHTIRIWEKRYNLLVPERTDTNIRRYNTENLKKILDITYLYNQGHKISKIARLDKKAIKEIILSSITDESAGHVAINEFKKAMLTFDTEKFNLAYNKLSLEYSFDQIFTTVFLPLLSQIGTLWHTEAIDLSHERFISQLVKRKTIYYIEKESLKRTSVSFKQTICLFLPKNEAHDIGLLYASYLLNKHEFNTLYLGQDIPLQCLPNIPNSKNMIFMAYLTVAPDLNETIDYVHEFNTVFKTKNPPQLWLLGSKSKKLDETLLPNNIQCFNELDVFIKTIQSLNN